MKFLITYGNQNYQKAKERLILEAHQTQQFDVIKAYGPEDLPPQITSNPLFMCEKGGGYWIWKSYIIHDMLSQIKENDIIIYVDAGCNLYPTDQWNHYFAIMQKYDLLAFCINCINKRFIKKDVIEYFTPNNGETWKHFYQIAGGILFVKKTDFSLNFTLNWKELSSSNLVADVPPERLANENKGFIGHRHDQAILTGLIYQHMSTHKIKIIWNDFESLRPGQAIHASRISDHGKRSSDIQQPFKQMIKACFVLPLRSLRQLFWELVNKYSRSI